MKNIKSKKQLKDEAIKLYGGLNTKNPPFNVGDKIKQIYRVDENDDLIKDGRELYEFVGMYGDLPDQHVNYDSQKDMMLLKTLNSYAAHSEDTVNKDVVDMLKTAGHKPNIGDIKQLHFMYADRFEII